MAEALVIGGGPAGSAAAITLARAGRRVTLVEREAASREKVCGEFLGQDAAQALATLGIDLVALGAVPIANARVAHRQGAAGFALPFAAWGLPRRVMDEALLAEAARAGATVLRGEPVRDAGRDGDDWRVRLADGSVLRAPHCLLATGKHALRGFTREGRAHWIGAKLHLRLRGALDSVTLLPCAGGYAGLQPGPDGIANLCAALTDAQVARDADVFMAHVAAGSPLAAALLAGAEPTMTRPLTIARVPYGYLHCDPADADPGLWRLGDQFSVIPSFCGDGMAMAMTGGMAAARAILDGEAAPAFHARWRARLRPAMRVAGAASFVMHRAPRVFSTTVAVAPPVAQLVARRTRVTSTG